MTEIGLKKGGLYVWRKDDPRHRATLQVTQVTKHLVRAVALTVSHDDVTTGERFWNPKCIFLEECTPLDVVLKERDSTQETVPARPCVWRDGCKNPSVCDKQGVCVPGGEATDCTCKDYPGADEFCTAHKSQPCGAPLDADGVDKCERQKGHTGVCGLDCLNRGESL